MKTSTAQSKNSCKTAAVMNLLKGGTAEGRIVPAQPEEHRDIEAITVEILNAKRAGGEAILTIGRGLIEAKALLPHGEWLTWLEERVEFSEKAAQRFMLLARKYSNPTTLSDLGASKALILLAIPDEVRDEFIEASHVVDGKEKTVSDMSVRELKAAIKERDEALKAAARAREAEEAAARLSAQLEELKSRPVDVAVQVDEAAVAAARKEVEAAMQDKLKRATAARDAALQKRYELEEALTQARAALEKAVADGDVIRAQAERAEKRAALSANGDVLLFRTLFDQAQETVNKLTGVLMKLRGRDPDTAGRLAQAMLALGEKVKGAAQG